MYVCVNENSWAYKYLIHMSRSAKENNKRQTRLSYKFFEKHTASMPTNQTVFDSFYQFRHFGHYWSSSVILERIRRNKLSPERRTGWV